MSGHTGKDILIGGAGNDTLLASSSGTSSDNETDIIIFDVRPGDQDVVKNFEVAYDKIDLTTFASFTEATGVNGGFIRNFNDLTMAQIGSSTVISFANNQKITLENVNKTSLTENNFIGLEKIDGSNVFYVRDKLATYNDNITSSHVFYIHDIDPATGVMNTDDADAINAAINAANTYTSGNEYARGIVTLEARTYTVRDQGSPSKGSVLMKSNTILKGHGMEHAQNGHATILQVASDVTAKISGIVRTPSSEITKNVAVMDITVDGNREALPVDSKGKKPEIDGFFSGVSPSLPYADENIYLLRMEVKNNTHYGFDPHEQTLRLTIRDSVAHHNGLDGFVADYIVDGLYENNIAFDNDRHGFNIVTSTHDFVLRNNMAFDNGSGGITIQRGTEDIAWPGDILVDGGEYYGNAKEGILIKLSEHVTIQNANIHDNLHQGIRLQGATDSIVTNNNLYNNGTEKADTYDEIEISNFYDSDTTKRTYDSNDNTITGNTISLNSATQAVNDSLGAQNSHYSANNINTTLSSATLIGTKGSDNITGSNGNDKIFGDMGEDILSGGNGADYFIYKNISDSTVTSYDTITDFTQGQDKIDLVTLNTFGIESFTDLTITSNIADNETVISANGNILAEPSNFELHIMGIIDLQESDFVWG